MVEARVKLEFLERMDQGLLDERKVDLIVAAPADFFAKLETGDTDARINSHSRSEGLSREHHVDYGRHALCRASRGRWNCSRQTSHTREHDFRPTGRVGLALDCGSFRR